jgi:hypothetical protein
VGKRMLRVRTLTRILAAHGSRRRNALSGVRCEGGVTEGRWRIVRFM